MPFVTAPVPFPARELRQAGGGGLSKRNWPAPLQHNREPNAIARTTTCPDCGLVLHVTDDALGLTSFTT
jgi:hypothetical protein